MKKLITFVLLLIGIFSFGSLHIYANDVTYTFDEDKYQIIPKDLSGTEWTIKDIEDIDFNIYNPDASSYFMIYNINIIIINEQNDISNSSVLYTYFIYNEDSDTGYIYIYDEYELEMISIILDDTSLSSIGYNDYGPIDSIKFVDGDDIKNQGLISFMIQFFDWKNPPTPDDPIIPIDPETPDDKFLSDNDLTKLMIALVIYIVALFLGILTKSKLLIALTGLLWIIPLVTIDSLIIKLFAVIMLIISFMVLLKERDDYYD